MSGTWTYHRQVAWGRTAGLDGVGQDLMPTEVFAKEIIYFRILQHIIDTLPEHHPRRTNKRTPVYLSNPKPGHTTSGLRRGTQRLAGQGRVGLGSKRIDLQANKGPSYVPGHRRIIASMPFQETRTSEVLKSNAVTESTLDPQFIRDLQTGPEKRFFSVC